MDKPTIEFPTEPTRSVFDSPVATLLLLLMCIFIGYMLGVLFIGLLLGDGLLYSTGQESSSSLEQLLYGLNKDSSLEDRNLARTVNFISHLFAFTIPSLLCMYFIHQRSFLKELQLTKAPKLDNLGLGMVFILVAIPFTQFTYWLNKQLPLPTWASSIEEQTEALIEGLLVMNSPMEFFFSLSLMAILPAIGEELLFRGIIQQKLQNWTKTAHLAIWLSAIIFSLFHLQFEGFIPRMFLGALLGYLFYWTQNLWIPIFAHFIFNGIQVFAQYALKDQIEEVNLEQATEANWLISLVSLFLLLILANFIKTRNQINT